MDKKAYFKKVTAVVLSALLLILCCGCGAVKNPAPAVEEEEETTDFTKYVGSWICKEASMDITSTNPEVLSIGFYFPDGDESRIAIIEQAILTSSIENNTVTVAFSDSWNSSGTTVITFEEDRIIYELKDVVSGSGAWGVSEGKYYFVRDDSAEEETGDFDDDFYEYEEVKASEILADMGITEDEFRESCTLMHWSSAEGIVGTDQLLEYPENYIGKRLVMGINNYIEKKYERGFIGLDHKRVSEDAVTYVTTYYEFTLVITDLRVDVYSPSITTNDSICPYMIFTGVDPDGSLCFDMISVDIS